MEWESDEEEGVQVETIAKDAIDELAQSAASCAPSVSTSGGSLEVTRTLKGKEEMGMGLDESRFADSKKSTNRPFRATPILLQPSLHHTTTPANNPEMLEL